MSRSLVALPVYNENQYVHDVLDEVSRHTSGMDVLVVDDGSSDGTAERLKERADIAVVTHEQNQGYGAALISAFCYAIRNDYDFIVTIDCDGQHEPQRIPQFLAACRDADIVSGSRYLEPFDGDKEPPGQRRWVNQVITGELNRQLGLRLTDGFCGFKAYRVQALQHLHLTETGYAMPLELWVQAARAGLRIVELPVPLIYLDETRSFGGSLDDARTRLEYYHLVLQRSIEAADAALRASQPLCNEGRGGK